MHLDSLLSRARHPLFWLLSVCWLALTGCPQHPPTLPPALQQIKQAGILVVITRNTPSTYFQDRNGATGFEFELAQAFAEQLGVELQVISVDNIEQLFSALLKQPTPALITAGLTQTPSREGVARFSTGYLEVVPQVVFHSQDKRPKTAADLVGKRILVLKNSTHQERLQALQEEHPELIFEVSDQVETVDLLRMVDEGQIDITIVNSNELAMQQVYFPNIQLGFSLQPSYPLQWAITPPQQPADTSLLDAVNAFLSQVQEDGTLSALIERYYGHLDTLGYVGANAFAKHLQQRLPKYEELFRHYADEFALDWRLLAAVGYQESHWHPEARSKTGVRGLMMLTQRTAEELGVTNRLDPKQSIRGGAQYLAQMLSRLPDSIEYPERYWFALAAYNVGQGHLEDARRLTQQAGLDPDSWIDVRSILPRLSQKQWYSQTRYGFARGGEPVHFVNNIRRYNDILNWATQPQMEDTQITAEQAHAPGFKPDP